MSSAPFPANQTKRILVIGATGAQGSAVIKALLEPSSDGKPSPYSIRALTRDPTSKRAQDLLKLGDVELHSGSYEDLSTVQAALKGIYGAYVNTDGFTSSEETEIFVGMRIFELAAQVPTLKHYVWGSIDYYLKLGGYDSQFRCSHGDGKGRVADWMKAQPCRKDGFVWSVLTTTLYMETLRMPTFGPLVQRDDGVYVFSLPLGSGKIPMLSLLDLGFFARYIFDNRDATAGQDLVVASDLVSSEYLVSTFIKVTGKPAIHVDLPYDEWSNLFDGVDRSVSSSHYNDPSSTTLTWRENFRGWWNAFRHEIVPRDLVWARTVHPGLHDLEKWMRKTEYKGEKTKSVLSNLERGNGTSINQTRLDDLVKRSLLGA